MYTIRLVAISLLIAAFLGCSTALAQKAVSGVRVQVRTVMGSGVLEAKEAQVDKRLSDLKAKLSKLRFGNYTLLSARNELIPLAKKEVINLQDGHTLILRPLYVKDNRVGMWLKWKDGQGMKIIDSRMHFDCGENILTGTEDGSDSAVILAIKVRPE